MKSIFLQALLIIFIFHYGFAQSSSISGKVNTFTSITQMQGPIYAAVLTNVQTQEKISLPLVETDFRFDNVPNGHDYELTIVQTRHLNDFLNGVSTLDMVMIQRHLLGIDPFAKEEMHIAADVNGDGYVSVYDLLYLRRLILGINNFIAESWRVRSKADLKLNSIAIKNLSQDIINADFAIIKVGDINGSAK